jgi:hypothetical protein
VRKTWLCLAGLIAVCLFVVELHFHDESHRYDVVGFAAGAGGSQDHGGDTKIQAYLVDHKTGRVWVIAGGTAGWVVPTVRFSCAQTDKDWNESESGCTVPDSSSLKK